MFEIASDDIAFLNDKDLRALVGLLCESEARKRGLSASFVTWGGNQNAADRGIDVGVALPSSVEIDGFVPRPATGFQVKKSDISSADIRQEMRPEGVLRPAIRDLADRSGAYIIVSSASWTSDFPLQNRRAAMREAINDLPNSAALTLDFYDRGRLASWVRDHVGLVPWVREKIGRAIRGWRPYGAWAYPPEGLSGEYLLDDKVRIRTSSTRAGGTLQALEALSLVRERLMHPGSVVRLVGLSGVGKTRFVQSLFDDRVGQQSLNPSIAAYTNVADGPDPEPTGLASSLIASRQRAILIVDNCQPDLHRRLSDACRVPESTVSVITVEYDIREDQAEGTEVFKLEGASDELVEKLVKHRFPHISQVDSRKIAEFSGGNARIAIALSETVGRQETLAGMSDEGLFRRLFQQRHESSDSLLLAAQVLSLVYSFQGEDDSDDDQAELFRFGALIGKNAREMFQSTAELLRRGLVQQRSVWRAVLPQAIANRLAAGALQNVSSAAIEAGLIDGAPERLIKSFSRRLGYLDSSQEARSIAGRWLGVGGRLEKVTDLDDLGRIIFNNVAPVAPDATLAAIERVVLETDDREQIANCRRYVQLLRSLAYDPLFFERCIALILRIAEVQEIDAGENESSKVFASLFPIYFSGTHATIVQRLGVIKSLLLSDEPRKRTLGLMALKAALEASHFGTGYNFEFGARSRDFGYWPRTLDDMKLWFGETLKLAEGLACLDGPAALEVRSVVAQKFRGLCTIAAIYDDLERVCQAISQKSFWSDGWLAVRQTIFYDSKGFSPEILTRLSSLELRLQPKTLAQKVRSIVLSEAVIYIGLNSISGATNDIEKSVAQVEAMAHELGKAVALEPDIFTDLLPDLIAGNSQQLWTFARGLAESTEKRREIWNEMVTRFSVTAPRNRNVQLFLGFLNGLKATDPELVDAFLDDAFQNEPLAQWYPLLQTAVGIDEKGVNRLMNSLELGKAQIWIYRSLVAGGVTHQISGLDFNRLLLRIAKEAGGWDIAIKILHMRISFDREWKKSSTSQIMDIGCELMRQLRFARERDDGDNYTLGMIAQHCLVGEKGVAIVREICRNLRDAVSKSETSPFYQQELLQVLLRVQPLAALEALCGDNAADLQLGISILNQASRLRRNAFDEIADADLVTWCDQQAESRYPAVAGCVAAFQLLGDRPQWTSIALKLLDKSPDRVAVLKKFIGQFGSVGWNGSYAAAVESNARLLDDLAQYPDSALVDFVAKEKIRLFEAIRIERKNEIRIEREKDERFE